MRNNEILRVENLTRVFKTKNRSETTALNHVSFSLKENEILGIVGESGSGKSTLAKLIARLIDPTEGSIYLMGRDITRLKGRALFDVYDKIQMVFQNPESSFNPRQTLGQGIGEYLRNYKVPEAQISAVTAELLKQCGLDPQIVSRYPNEVSGGQCQRAAIARALSAEPRILICDEATSALDVTVQEQIINLLRSLHKERQMSYLFICHNLALVQSFCDRVIVLHRGSIAEEGTPDEIINYPRSEYTRRLIDSVLI